jgi:hypothetical protein
MPEPLRAAFDLPFGGAERRRAARALNIIRRGYSALPSRVLYVGPYHEAVDRLAGRSRPSLLTRSLNRLWIGRSAMND